MPFLTVIQNENRTRIEFSGTPVLRDLLVNSGFAVSSPCAGRGICGKCEVSVAGDVSEPNSVEKEHGCRLSCQTVLLGDATVRLSGGERFADIETDSVQDDLAWGSADWKYAAAVDIGTTTVVLKIFGADGVYRSQAAEVNPQRTVAADVIGRIDACLNGRAGLLKSQITDCIDRLLGDACRSAGISPDEVDYSVITGNTAMLYLYTGRSPGSIARAPFKSETLFGETLGNCYLPPCMDAFVGADITCAVLASGMCESGDVSLLCDIGTNGEIALWKDGRLFVTSTAAGPAFEGAEISCGCGSISGAVDRVWLENGEIKARTLDGAPAVGICGSGIVTAVAAFLDNGDIDPTGATDDPLVITANGGTVSLTQKDIRAVQLAVAAISAGIETVLSKSDTPLGDVSRLYLAGGFGNHLDVDAAARIGLIPKELSRCAVPIGNAALTGASMLLFGGNAVENARKIAANSVHVDLGGDSGFNNAFIEHMIFPEE